MSKPKYGWWGYAKMFSEPGQVVCDPFLGSGTTAVAAVKTERHYIGYEIDPGYFQICCERLDEAEEPA